MPSRHWLCSPVRPQPSAMGASASAPTAAAAPPARASSSSSASAAATVHDGEHRFLLTLDDCKTASVEARARYLTFAISIGGAWGLDFASSRCAESHCELCGPGAAVKMLWFALTRVDARPYAAPILDILLKSNAFVTPRDWVSGFRFVLMHSGAECASLLLEHCPRHAWLNDTRVTGHSDDVSGLLESAIRRHSDVSIAVAVGLIPHATDEYLNRRLSDGLTTVQLAADYGQTDVVTALVKRFPGVELGLLAVRSRKAERSGHFTSIGPAPDLVAAVESARRLLHAYDRDLMRRMRDALQDSLHVTDLLDIVHAYARATRVRRRKRTTAASAGTAATAASGL